MTIKNMVDQAASLKKPHIHDTSSTAQRCRLLERLRLQPVDNTSDDHGRPHHGIALYYLSASSASVQAEV